MIPSTSFLKPTTSWSGFWTIKKSISPHSIHEIQFPIPKIISKIPLAVIMKKVRMSWPIYYIWHNDTAKMPKQNKERACKFVKKFNIPSIHWQLLLYIFSLTKLWLYSDYRPEYFILMYPFFNRFSTKYIVAIQKQEFPLNREHCKRSMLCFRMLKTIGTQCY